MADNCEFEITETFHFEDTSNNTETFHSRLLLQAYKLAAARGFSNVLCNYFYLFRGYENSREFTIECDILDTSENKIAIECYLYKRHTSTFIAKSFSIFTEKNDIV